MADLPETATPAAFARIAGFKPGYISQLRKEGRLVMDADGKLIRVAESLARIAETRDPSKAGVAARHAAARAAAESHKDVETDEDNELEAPPGAPVNPVVSAYQEAKARNEHFKALAAQRDFEMSMCKLLDADEVEGVVANAVTVLRTRLEGLREQLAPQLAAESDEGRVGALLADEHEAALRELSRQFSQLAKGQGA